MKTNSKRYHLGIFFGENNLKEDVVVHNVPMTYTYQHPLYVAHEDRIGDLTKLIADLRCLNGMTWELYRYFILDTKNQNHLKVDVELVTRDKELWCVDVKVTYEGDSYAIYAYDKKRHVVEHESNMVAEIGQDGRYVLREKRRSETKSCSNCGFNVGAGCYAMQRYPNDADINHPSCEGWIEIGYQDHDQDR